MMKGDLGNKRELTVLARHHPERVAIRDTLDCRILLPEVGCRLSQTASQRGVQS